MARPTPEEARVFLSLAWSEVERLRERFAMRRLDEKKRVGSLERLIPKLKRLTKSGGVNDELNAEEQAVLDSLKPPAR
ncbi:MAG: hypothetical protein K1X64_22510 [Myxococcaceae bacterium]|nr:hypothetical protein [Myxococcaceae bacterium]